MIAIDFEVTSYPLLPVRLNTIQTFEAKVVSKFPKPTITPVRTYTAAMDYRSGKGTYIASKETFSMEIVFHDDEIDGINELVYSLMDYQIASLDGTEIPKLGAVRNFRMMNSEINFQPLGCSSNKFTLNGLLLP